MVDFKKCTYIYVHIHIHWWLMVSCIWPVCSSGGGVSQQLQTFQVQPSSQQTSTNQSSSDIHNPTSSTGKTLAPPPPGISLVPNDNSTNQMHFNLLQDNGTSRLAVEEISLSHLASIKWLLFGYLQVYFRTCLPACTLSVSHVSTHCSLHKVRQIRCWR